MVVTLDNKDFAKDWSMNRLTEGETAPVRLPRLFLLRADYQMITRSSSGRNIAPSVMPKAA